MKIQVCMGKTCRGKFAEYILKRLKADTSFYNLDGIIIEESPCMGFCDKGPNVMFDKHLEHYMNPIKTSKIMLDKKNGVIPKKKKNYNHTNDN